jgi:RNA polymerase sigma-70 factor, ECF subfamily
MKETSSQRQEALLVLRAQSGDRGALDVLLRSVQQPLFGYLLRLVGERAIAEDVLQDAFFLIYRKLRWLEEPLCFRPWAYRIASREAFRAMKRERRWTEQVRDEEVLSALAAPAADEGEFGPELIERLPQLFARLSPASRAVLVLHYMHEMSLAEVADVLGLADGTVKSRLAYGLATLRRALAERGSVAAGAMLETKKETSDAR